MRVKLRGRQRIRENSQFPWNCSTVFFPFWKTIFQNKMTSFQLSKLKIVTAGTYIFKSLLPSTRLLLVCLIGDVNGSFKTLEIS